jgi:hypothetical protein
VARLHVIFDLPKHLGIVPHPLAYVHWYRPLTSFDLAAGMYQITLSTRQNSANAEVVSIDRIWHSCLLIPHFGSADVPTSWTGKNALDSAAQFYLNKYTDMHSFMEYKSL